MTQEELIAAQTIERTVCPLARELFIAAFRAGNPVDPEYAFRWAAKFETVARERFMKLL